jgi:hypothetical protein
VWGLASAEHLWTPSFLLDVSIARHQPPTFTITFITALTGIRSTVPRIKCRFNFICVKNSQRRRRRSEEEGGIDNEYSHAGRRRVGARAIHA